MVNVSSKTSGSLDEPKMLVLVMRKIGSLGAIGRSLVNRLDTSVISLRSLRLSPQYAIVKSDG